MLAVFLSSGLLIGAGGALAALASATAGWATHRLAQRRLGPELHNLAADYEGKIAAAARDAVDVIERALKTSEGHLERMAAQLEKVEMQLERARKDLRAALVERDERDELIIDLRTEVRRLEARVVGLEQQIARHGA